MPQCLYYTLLSAKCWFCDSEESKSKHVANKQHRRGLFHLLKAGVLWRIARQQVVRVENAILQPTVGSPVGSPVHYGGLPTQYRHPPFRQVSEYSDVGKEGRLSGICYSSEKLKIQTWSKWAIDLKDRQGLLLSTIALLLSTSSTTLTHLKHMQWGKVKKVENATLLHRAHHPLRRLLILCFYTPYW